MAPDPARTTNRAAYIAACARSRAVNLGSARVCVEREEKHARNADELALHAGASEVTAEILLAGVVHGNDVEGSATHVKRKATRVVMPLNLDELRAAHRADEVLGMAELGNQGVSVQPVA